MDFVEGKCPKCSGDLRLPKDFEKILCMYCGEELTRQDLGWEKVELNFNDNYTYAITHIPEILLAHRGIMESFKKDIYADSIEEYTKVTKPIFEAMDRACYVSSINQEKILKECADAFVIGIMKDLDQNQEMNSKKKRTQELENYKIILALYTIPMLGLQKMQAAEAFSDVLVNRWVEEFPKMTFQKGTFEDINGGFRKGRFCYITTAVCETLNKTDDCYELTMFRKFRDDYMLRHPMGEELVREYYELAPVIVNRINQRLDSSQVYEEIWRNDLASCLKNIEVGNPQACMDNYMKMVRKLQKQYS